MPRHFSIPGDRTRSIGHRLLLFCAVRQAGYNFGMDDEPFNIMFVVVPTLGLALAAFAVWLTVRIVNRRERWALWTAAALAMILVCCAICLAPGSGMNGLYEHDWTAYVNGYTFGIDQFDSDISERLELTEPTSIHLGLTSVRTSFSAYQVLGIGAVGALLLIAGVALIITRVGRARTA